MCLFVAPVAAAGAAAAGTAAGAAAAGTATAGIAVGSAAAAAALNSALVGLATTGISMVAQQQQASASNRMMRQRQEFGTRLAKENYAKQIEAAFTRTSQEREAAADEIAKISSEGRKAAALAALSAGERGVAGQGIDQIYADFESQELRYQTNLKRSLNFREQAIQNNLDQARRGMQTNIMNLQFMPRSGPNLLAGALQVGASAFDSYQRYKFYGPNPKS
tara:strand:+ start:20579 stop:21241 length:663 start_codon:yes stop_codon:yes gene_type:complete